MIAVTRRDMTTDHLSTSGPGVEGGRSGSPWELSAVALSSALRWGDLSAVQVFESIIGRADAVGGSVNAFSVDLPDRALVVSPTPFNLLGTDRWVANFTFVNWYDSFEGSHPRVFVPDDRPYREWHSMEEINNELLRHPEVEAFIRSKGQHGLAAFVMFDEETETLACQLGLRIIHPRASLRRFIDSKTNTVRLGDQAGVPSVPNVLATVCSWADLRRVAKRAMLGDDLVVQAPYVILGGRPISSRGRPTGRPMVARSRPNPRSRS
jgi:hypothetical protein